MTRARLGGLLRVRGTASVTVGTLAVGGVMSVVFAALLVRTQGADSSAVAAFFTGTAAYRLSATLVAAGCENAVIAAVSRSAGPGASPGRLGAIGLASMAVARRRTWWWSVAAVMAGGAGLAIATRTGSLGPTVSSASLGVLLSPTAAYLRVAASTAVVAIRQVFGAAMESVVPQAGLLMGLLIPVATQHLATVLLLLQAAIILASAVIVQFTLRRRARGHAASDADLAEVRGVIGQTANNMLVINALAGVLEQFDVLVLGLAMPPGQVNAYALAKRLVGPLVVVAGGVGTHFVPGLARTHHEEGPSAAVRALRGLRPRLLVVALTAALGILLLGVFVNTPDLGPSFLVALGLLTAGQVVNVVVGPVGIFLQTTGSSAPMRRISVWLSLVYILSTLALAPTLGAVGAALAQGGASVVKNVWWTAMASKRARSEDSVDTAPGSGVSR